MKKLVLVRHAKSSWDDPTLRDHESTSNSNSPTEHVGMCTMSDEKLCASSLNSGL